MYTFYPPPEEVLGLQIEELNRRETAIRDSRPPAQLTDADRAEIAEINAERNALVDAQREAGEG